MDKNEAIAILQAARWQRVSGTDEIRTKIEPRHVVQWREALDALLPSSPLTNYNFIPDYPFSGYSHDTALPSDMPQTVVVYRQDNLAILAKAGISFSGSSSYLSGSVRQP